MNFSRLLAGRYLNPARSHVSVITFISLIGVMLGVTVLVVVLSIHAGFEVVVKNTVLGLAPHIEVQEQDGVVRDWKELEERLETIEGVEGTYAIIQDIVLVDAPGYRKPVSFRAIDTSDEGQIAALDKLLDKKAFPTGRADMGIDEYAVVSRQLANDLGLSVGDEFEIYASRNFDSVKNAFERTNVEPLKERFSDELQGFQAVVLEGRNKTEISVDELSLFYEEVRTLTEEQPRDQELTALNEILITLGIPDRNEAQDAYLVTKEIWDTIDTELLKILNLDVEAADIETLKGLREFVLPKKLIVWGVYGDSQRTPGPGLFIPLPIGQELTGFSEVVQAVAVRLEDPYLAAEAADKISKELGVGYYVTSWTKRHEAQFSILQLEKVMLTLSLSLIAVISTFSIMAVMYTFVIQKKQEIGVMKALGAKGSQISWVFLYQGLVVGFFGALSGIALSLLILWRRADIQQFIGYFGLQPFKEEFHGVSEIPAKYLPGFMGVVGVSAWLLCGLAALLPAIKAARNDAAKSLRNL